LVGCVNTVARAQRPATFSQCTTSTGLCFFDDESGGCVSIPCDMAAVAASGVLCSSYSTVCPLQPSASGPCDTVACEGATAGDYLLTLQMTTATGTGTTSNGDLTYSADGFEIVSTSGARVPSVQLEGSEAGVNYFTRNSPGEVNEATFTVLGSLASGVVVTLRTTSSDGWKFNAITSVVLANDFQLVSTTFSVDVTDSASGTTETNVPVNGGVWMSSPCTAFPGEVCGDIVTITYNT